MRQRAFLELLPLIFHQNHPALPGFISSNTPAGIPGYTPGKRTLSKATVLSKSFDYKKTRLKNHPIHGLYLMGSVGSIAYSKKSDLDFWLCHQGNLSADELDELQQKTVAIEKWATTLALEAHFFFINVDEFRHGKGSAISEESCGSTQHHLLLEEFYRTGLYIAGRIPLWWLVPSHQDTTYSVYTKHLIAQRFIDEDEVIDFGGLEKVPAEEFLGASLWHLYKAFKDPHKSLLKLLLMEAYATEYPQTKWLSLELKEAIYSGQFDPDDLDPYILMYEKVEHYLLSMEASRRLDLARECFYININELLSKKSALPRQRQRREALRKMITKWGWTSPKVSKLDGRKVGGIEKLLAERNLIAQELIDGYQLLNRFASKHTESRQPDNHEIKLLGRKLQALLEKKPGKVEIVNPYNNNRARQQKLYLTETEQAGGAMGWAVHLDHSYSSPPLAKARHLTELLGWIVLNGLYGSETHVALHTRNSALSTRELDQLIRTLIRYLTQLPGKEGLLEAYQKPAVVVACVLFVNIGEDPLDGRKDGMQMLSSRSDALSYGFMRQHLIKHFEQLYFTSWGEILTSRYEESEGLFDWLCDTLNNSLRLKPPRLDCYSFSSPRATSIAFRITELYKTTCSVFHKGDPKEPPRLIVRSGQSFNILRRQGSLLKHWNAPTFEALQDELNLPQFAFSPVIFEEYALEDSPLPALYKINQPRIQVFFLPDQQHADVFVIDERGSLFYQKRHYINAEILLAPYALLLNSVIQRYASLDNTIEYYAVKKNTSADYSVIKIPFNPLKVQEFLKLRVVGEELKPGRTAYTLYCNEEEFSSLDYGDNVISEAASYIINLRKSGERYPVYITDIDVPLNILGIDSPEQLQTVHLLNYKRKIENRLNKNTKVQL